MATVRIIDRGLSFNQLATNAQKLAAQAINVGVLRTAGKEKGGTDLVAVAAYNEFGTAHIPARPFLRIASDKNQDKWQKLMGDVAARVTANQMGVQQAQKLLGNQAVGDVQKVIGNRGLLAPNKPATIKKKGSSAPLIDSGNLRQSISFEVR